MTDLIEEEIDAPVRFGQQERRGNFFGLTGAQVSVLGGVVAVCLIALFTLQVWSWPVWIVGVLVAVVTVWRFRGEPVVSMAATMLSYVRRRLAGQHLFVRDVWEPAWESSTITAEQGGVRSVTSRATLKMPGALRDVQTFDIDHAGGFVLDRRSKRAAITLAAQSQAWQLRDPDAQAATSDGFMAWLNGLEHTTGLVGAIVRVRADRSSSTELADYVDEHGAPHVSEALDREYALLIEEGSGRAFAFSASITVTFDLDALARPIKDAGGGLPGVGHVLDQYVTTLTDSAAAMGVRVEAWLTGDELERSVTTAWDPIAAARRRAEGLETLDSAPVMGIEEGWSWVRADESVHRVFWVAEWPRQKARIGFLEPLLMSGSSSRTVVLEVVPRPTHRALKEAGKALTDMELASILRTRMGMRVSRKQQREHQDVAWRERDLVDGHAQSSFRGFLIASADTMDDLSRGASDIEAAGHRARIVIQTMHAQQAAAFVRTMLPIPMGGDS